MRRWDSIGPSTYRPTAGFRASQLGELYEVRGDEKDAFLRLQVARKYDTDRTLLQASAVLRASVRNQLELVRARPQLAELAVVDYVTDLANRRRLEEVLEGECRRLRRNGFELSLILVAVDGEPQPDLREIGSILIGVVDRAAT